MITVKSFIYTKEDFRFISDVIAIGISEACDDYERNCSKCKLRFACRDLAKARDYCNAKV